MADETAVHQPNLALRSGTFWSKLGSNESSKPRGAK